MTATLPHSALLLLHFLAAIAWIGGMFFAHFCLRPAAIETLQPPQRLPLLAATFRRFFRIVDVAVAVLLATGFAMLLPVGFARAPIGWHAMLALGLVMAGVFAYIRAALFPALRTHCAASAWPAAGQVIDRIRRLVGVNLVLGIGTVVAAVAAR